MKSSELTVYTASQKREQSRPKYFEGSVSASYPQIRLSSLLLVGLWNQNPLISFQTMALRGALKITSNDPVTESPARVLLEKFLEQPPCRAKNNSLLFRGKQLRT